MKRQSVRTVATVMLIVLTVAPGAWAWYPYSEKYTKWQKQRPLMMAGLHNCVPTDRLTSRVARFKASGLNTFVWLKPGRAHNYFQAVHEIGISWAAGHRGGISVVAEALKIPGCAYIMTADEPSGTTPEDFTKIATLAEWMRENHPDIPQFVQLSITKADHDVVVETAKPDIFSFDQYPLYADGSLDEHYLYNVMWARQTAQNTRCPTGCGCRVSGDR